MIKNLFICIFAAFTMVAVSGQEIEGEGIGSDAQAATKFALDDLASQIQIQVISQSEAIKTVQSKNGKMDVVDSVITKVQTSTNLPLLGLEFVPEQVKGKDHIVRVKLGSKKALKLYLSQMDKILADITKNQTLLEKTKERGATEKIILSLLNASDDFWRHWIVARALGYKEIPELPVNELELRLQLSKVQSSYDDIAQVADALLRTLPSSKIYVYPPMSPNSSEVTQLGHVIRDTIQSKLKSATTNPRDADYTLRGSYIKTQTDLISLTYTLNDKNGNLSGTFLYQLARSAYSPYQFEPSTMDIEKLAKDGYVVSSDFKVEATTNLGRSDLFFKASEEVEVLVRLSRAGYLYCIEHLVGSESSYSAILELGEQSATDGRRFVKYVGPDDVNKWVSLGKFKVVRPFGVERLQFIASTKDVIRELPPYVFDEKYGFYAVQGGPKEAIISARGLQRINETKEQNAEFILTYTAFER